MVQGLHFGKKGIKSTLVNNEGATMTALSSNQRASVECLGTRSRAQPQMLKDNSGGIPALSLVAATVSDISSFPGALCHPQATSVRTWRNKGVLMTEYLDKQLIRKNGSS